MAALKIGAGPNEWTARHCSWKMKECTVARCGVSQNVWQPVLCYRLQPLSPHVNDGSVIRNSGKRTKLFTRWHPDPGGRLRMRIESSRPVAMETTDKIGKCKRHALVYRSQDCRFPHFLSERQTLVRYCTPVNDIFH